MESSIFGLWLRAEKKTSPLKMGRAVILKFNSDFEESLPKAIFKHFSFSNKKNVCLDSIFCTYQEHKIKRFSPWNFKWHFAFHKIPFPLNAAVPLIKILACLLIAHSGSNRLNLFIIQTKSKTKEKDGV